MKMPGDEIWINAIRAWTPASEALIKKVLKQVEVSRATEPPLPRVIECESEDLLYALLSSLNDAGNQSEVACLSNLNEAPFLATLWDVDYAAVVHYVFTEGDSGQVHCHTCAECYAHSDRSECDYDSPGFPIYVVLTESPPPSDTLDDSITDWWATA